MDWYYLLNERQIGPVTHGDFEGLVRDGTVSAETQVWHEGMAAWQPYGELSPAGGTAVATLSASEQIGGVVCSECGRTFAPDEVVRFGNNAVCAGCKPVFVQKLKEGVAPTAALEYATVWTRFCAVFVDGLLLWAVNFVVGMLILAPMGLRLSRGQAEQRVGTILALQGVTFLIQLLIRMSYETWFIGRFGATPGKMACHVRVVTAQGQPISYARAMARFFAKILSGMILGIGYLMAVWDDEKRALHDRICDTRVVKVR